jgi:hypothetical protein
MRTVKTHSLLFETLQPAPAVAQSVGAPSATGKGTSAVADDRVLLDVEGFNTEIEALGDVALQPRADDPLIPVVVEPACATSAAPCPVPTPCPSNASRVSSGLVWPA